LLYQFPSGDWQSNLKSLAELSYRAVIVGRYGTGKSTLVRELLRRLSGEPVVRPVSEPNVTARAKTLGEHGSISSVVLLDVPRVDSRCWSVQRWWTAKRRQRRAVRGVLDGVDQGTLVLVDGIERLNWWQRQWLVRRTASPRKVAGLVVIVHHRHHCLPLPTWVQAVPSAELLARLIDELLRDETEPQRRRFQAQGRSLFASSDQNLRTVLRQLYDQWQRLSMRNA
jgi:hypothetical protein